MKAAATAKEEADQRSSTSSTSSSSSSIGRNTDDMSGRSSDGVGGDIDENEAQSSCKGGLTLNTMDSLQQVLPMRRGISSFYIGKPKSFTSLADASSASSIEEIAKPENSYTRRRKNLFAINHLWHNNRNNKRPNSSSNSTFALALAMSSSESISSTSDDSTSNSSPRLPPLHPQSRTSLPYSGSRNCSNWRSFSLADVREYIGSMNPDCASFHYDN